MSVAETKSVICLSLSEYSRYDGLYISPCVIDSSYSIYTFDNFSFPVLN
jgi:hypothetical protein